MHARDQELEGFKTNTDLAPYAKSRGYAHDPKNNCPSATPLRGRMLIDHNLEECSFCDAKLRVGQTNRIRIDRVDH